MAPPVCRFQLGESCKLVLIEGDITKWSVNGRTDAIVNAANESLLGGGGVDGRVHDAAGPELFNYCMNLPARAPGSRCPVGDAVPTPAFKLPVSKIIHTVGPTYDAANAEENARELELAFKTSLSVARSEGIEYIALPAVSCGLYCYPANQAAEIAISVCKSNYEGFTQITFCLIDPAVWRAWVAAATKAGLVKIEADPDENKKPITCFSRWCRKAMKKTGAPC